MATRNPPPTRPTQTTAPTATNGDTPPSADSAILIEDEDLLFPKAGRKGRALTEKGRKWSELIDKATAAFDKNAKSFTVFAITDSNGLPVNEDTDEGLKEVQSWRQGLYNYASKQPRKLKVEMVSIAAENRPEIAKKAGLKFATHAIRLSERNK